jgi:hypothetical protein
MLVRAEQLLGQPSSRNGQTPPLLQRSRNGAKDDPSVMCADQRVIVAVPSTAGA